eukprot:2683651-Rhodomonas_salina.1
MVADSGPEHVSRRGSESGKCVTASLPWHLRPSPAHAVTRALASCARRGRTSMLAHTRHRTWPPRSLCQHRTLHSKSAQDPCIHKHETTLAVQFALTGIKGKKPRFWYSLYCESGLSHLIRDAPRLSASATCSRPSSVISSLPARSTIAYLSTGHRSQQQRLVAP